MCVGVCQRKQGCARLTSHVIPFAFYLQLLHAFICDMHGQEHRGVGGPGGVAGHCRIRIASLLFVDDVASLFCDLQHSLYPFAAECEVAGIKIFNSKSEAMVLSRKLMDCSLYVGN